MLQQKSFQLLTYISLPILLAGCVSTSTQMLNDKGQVANCGANGLGVIGAPAAYLMSQECISKYEAAGFRRADSPKVNASAPTPATPPINTTALIPTTLSDKDGTLKIELPAGWESAPITLATVKIAAKNSSNGGQLVISTTNLLDIKDWLQYSESLRAKLANSLQDVSNPELVKIKVNGLDALRAEISGSTKAGIKVHYLTTVIKSSDRLIYVVSWSPESRFSLLKAEFESLANAVKM